MVHPTTMNTRKIALFATLVGLAVGTNYAMMGLWNIKFMDFIVFIGGFCLGPLAGGAMGITCWAVYGTLNPLGFSINILFATMFSEAIYGVAGGLVRRVIIGRASSLKEPIDNKFNVGIFLGVLGVLLTFVYEVITNVAWATTVNANLLVIFAAATPFTVAHLLSNAVFFGVGSVPVIRVIVKVLWGGEKSCQQ